MIFFAIATLVYGSLVRNGRSPHASMTWGQFHVGTPTPLFWPGADTGADAAAAVAADAARAAAAAEPTKDVAATQAVATHAEDRCCCTGYEGAGECWYIARHWDDVDTFHFVAGVHFGTSFTGGCPKLESGRSFIQSHQAPSRMSCEVLFKEGLIGS